MEIVIFYLLIFCIGTIFGSFFTLAIHRIPLHQDITHERSYCPKCNHKLGFWDMIPILSYIILNGKCRYCKSKIRIRYLILEVITGIVFLLFAMSLNINFLEIEISKLVYLLFGLLYIVGLIIISGIDKEKHEVTKSLLLYEISIISIYMIYLYVVEKANIYRYVIYLFVIILLLIVDNIFLKKRLKNNYTINILILSIIMSVFTYEIQFIMTVIFTLLSIGINNILIKIKENKNKIVKKDKNNICEIPIAFFLICTNIIMLIVTNTLACR